MNKTDCITEASWQLFLSGELSAIKKDECELHLTNCSACRRFLAEMYTERAADAEVFSIPVDLAKRAATIPNGPGEKKEDAEQSFFARIRIFWQFGFAAVFVVCFGLAGFFFLRSPAPPANTFRQGSSTSSSLNLLSPAKDAELPAETIEFRWSPVTNAKNYTLLVLDKKGDTVTQHRTGEITYVLDPLQSGLARGETYFWFIKATLGDGTTIDSDIAKFRIVK